MAEYLKDALAYAARGWSILPVCGKEPRLRSWLPYQSKPPTERQLRKWFGNGKVTGLAVICGPVSGGLVVMDFDDREAYKRWAAGHPELARTVPTVESRRGYHLYFRCQLGRSFHVKIDGQAVGELKGSGYIVLPPSKHPTGHTYRWLVPLSGGAQTPPRRGASKPSHW
jgi:hypothetical protein